jgi:asparagine synthase (glutamine-hydrolysing)
MSGIAGIVSFDGAPLEPGLIAKMTAAMAQRGPDAIEHWQRSHVALGHCMFRTTPESLAEHQPYANEDASLVLVMDGRVDNCDELRHNLLAQGAILRNQTDAELVLRAYETWGKQCPERIIGEFAFFIWDQRKRCLFGARDAVGTRHFYYHAGPGWFGFASEIKGLLATCLIDARLNESRLFDYLVPEFDRDDQIGTFYQDIVRLPAGHAMEVSKSGVKTWRYWDPGNFEPLKFSSLDECAEAFLDQLRIAVKCRLRSNGPVGAMLSGGLDSSSIVGLIRKEFRGELMQPLKTFSLIREDRENCKDWEHIEEMLKEGWVEPTVVTSLAPADMSRSWLDSMPTIDEPFALSHGLAYSMVYQAAQRNGCRVVLDGMAGDLLFYGPGHSLNLILRGRQFAQLPSIFKAYGRHGLESRARTMLFRAAATLTPAGLRTTLRDFIQRHQKPSADIALLRNEVAAPWLSEKRLQRKLLDKSIEKEGDSEAHSRYFKSGLLSFAHEVYGQVAFASGVEPRSPFSDRRMVEFAIQMPMEAKLSVPWYKYLARTAMAGVLPEAVRWRRDLGNHPGWKAYANLATEIAGIAPESVDRSYLKERLELWVKSESLAKALRDRNLSYENGHRLFILFLLSRWLDTHPHNAHVRVM